MMSLRLSRFRPGVLAALGLPMLLLACAGGDGDSAWRGDDGGYEDDPVTGGPSQCRLAEAPASGLTLKVCDLPENATLELIHQVSGVTDTVTLTGTGERTLSHTLDALREDDVLRLGAARVPAPQRYLVTCDFEGAAAGTEQGGDGGLNITGDANGQVQTVLCGRTWLASQTDISAADIPAEVRNETNRVALLRINVDTGRVRWLQDPDGGRVRDANGYQNQVYDHYAGGRYVLFNGVDPADPQALNRSLWSTDGTNGGSALVRFPPDNQTALMVTNRGQSIVLGDPELAYFIAYFDSGDIGSYVSDGTSEGTRSDELLDFGGESSGHALLGSRVLASQENAGGDSRTFSLLAKDIDSGEITTLKSDFTNYPMGPQAGIPYFVGERMYFRARDAGGFWLWVTDGTVAGTRPVSDMIMESLTPFQGALYFIAREGGQNDDAQLWKIDGDGELVRLFDIGADASNLGVIDLVATREALFFSVNLEFVSRSPVSALYVSDGTEAGTRRLRDDLMPATTQPQNGAPPTNWARYITGLHVVGDRVVFGDNHSAGRDPTNRVWVTDGTDEGTARLFPNAERSPIHSASACALGLCQAFEPISLGGAYLLFRAWRVLDAGQAGQQGELTFWLSDGTVTGTYRLRAQDGQLFSHPYSTVGGE
ncbi:hypothetical protein [Alcanivorax sp. 24]|uniref:hypothetical protein n=1 Tax=Alcanivorax sp. 24 TaxID=2545266 RepID=UPI00105F81E4|nr:hypothetical protein [Alcanivorax sp. 24]